MSAQRPAGADFNDPAFAANKTLPVHRWVPWIAGFSRAFVRDGLARHLDAAGPATVLDPFAGVGTTLLEANLAGHHAIGFEINPYAAFACRTKLGAHRAEPARLEAEAERLLCFHERAATTGLEPASTPPEGFKTRGVFYSPKVLRRVLLTQDFIDGIEDRTVADLSRLAFAATMVGYSNYSYEPSLSQRVSVGRPDVIDFPVEEVIAAKLRQMASDVGWLRERLGRRRARAELVNESFFEGHEHLAPGSVDLLITSPPYLNNYHYNRNTRPHLFWLGFLRSSRDLRALEERNFGKFWQTVRERKTLELDPIIRDAEIRETLATLREKNPEKGIYGGNGWANYATAYFNDCVRFARGAKRALRPGATALVVIGNSILQGLSIPTDRHLGAIAEAAGLEWVDVHVPRATRVGSSIIQSDVRVGKAKQGHRLYEAVVELRKR